MKNISIVLVFFAMVLLATSQVAAQKTESKYGMDSISCVTNLSLYREFYKQKNYADALPHWRWVFFNCPVSSQNIYIEGVKMMVAKINESKDQKSRDAYIDTLLMVYEARIKYFGTSVTSREGMVWGRAGVELENYRPSDTLRVYEYLRKSVEREGLNSEPIIVSRYFINVSNLVKNNRFPVDTIAENYDRLCDLVDKKT